MRVLLFLSEVALVAAVARIGWGLGGRVIYIYHALVANLSYSISKHLWLE